jgi:hypothetical protein
MGVRRRGRASRFTANGLVTVIWTFSAAEIATVLSGLTPRSPTVPAGHWP